jgi:hypothetical protein
LVEETAYHHTIAARTKEMHMAAHGHTFHWGTHIGIGGAKDRKRWSQQLRSWWTTHRAARQEASLASLRASWDVHREACTPLRAEAAYDLMARQREFSTASQVYGLTL